MQLGRWSCEEVWPPLPEVKFSNACLQLFVRSLRNDVSGWTVCSDLPKDQVQWHRFPARPREKDGEAKLPRSECRAAEADINPPPSAIPSQVRPWWMTPASSMHRPPRSRPLRAYPYNGIRRPVMETCAAAPIISCLTDQSLFRCLWGSSEMSPAADGELRVWLQLFNVKYQIHLSDSGFGRQEEPLVPPCDGCCIHDLFSASAEIVLVHYVVTVAPSVTQMCSVPFNLHV